MLKSIKRGLNIIEVKFIFQFLVVSSYLPIAFESIMKFMTHLASSHWPFVSKIGLHLVLTFLITCHR